MEHVWAAYTQEAKEFSYKRYVSDVVRLIGENVFYLTKGEGAGYYDAHWSDIVDPQKKEEQPLDGDAIALDIIKRAGLKFGEEQNGPV